MENCNIHFYKDGKDIILVFKNASSDLESVISGIIAGLTNVNSVERTVPGLEEPEQPDVPDIPSAALDDEIASVPEEFLNDDPAALLNDDSCANIFAQGPYVGMTPNEVIAQAGFKGFIYLCRAYIYEKESTIEGNTVLLDEIKTCIVNFYVKNNEIKARLAGSFDVKTARGFITNCYIFNHVIYNAVENGEYSSIEEYIKALSTEEIKLLSRALGETVILFFESIK